MHDCENKKSGSSFAMLLRVISFVSVGEYTNSQQYRVTDITHLQQILTRQRLFYHNVFSHARKEKRSAYYRGKTFGILPWQRGALVKKRVKIVLTARR